MIFPRTINFIKNFQHIQKIMYKLKSLNYSIICIINIHSFSFNNSFFKITVIDLIFEFAKIK